MWTYEYEHITTASAQRIFNLWSDVANWPTWNADVVQSQLHGEFAQGGQIEMTTQDGIVQLHLVDVRQNERFVDEAEVEGLVIRTTHRLQATNDGRTRIIYHMEITGTNAEQLGHQIGPAISADYPQTIAALARHAEG